MRIMRIFIFIGLGFLPFLSMVTVSFGEPASCLSSKPILNKEGADLSELDSLIKKLREERQWSRFEFKDPEAYPVVTDAISKLLKFLSSNPRVSDEKLMEIIDLLFQMIAVTIADEWLYPERVPVMLTMIDAVKTITKTVNSITRYKENFIRGNMILSHAARTAGVFAGVENADKLVAESMELIAQIGVGVDHPRLSEVGSILSRRGRDFSAENTQRIQEAFLALSL